MNATPRHLLIMYSTHAPSAAHLQRLAALSPQVRVEAPATEAAAVAHAPHAEVILGHRYLWQTLPDARALRWVQASGAGVDHLRVPALFERKPLLTRCPIFSNDIAWHALSLGLAVLRKLPAHHGTDHQAAQLDPPSPVPRNVMVFGVGEIGGRLATLLHGLGCRVVGVSRRGIDRTGCCAMMCGPTDWRRELPSIDALFLCAGATEQTRGILDAATLALLPEHAVLVNVGRGALVDHAALADRLEADALAGAGLDVLDTCEERDRQRLARRANVIMTPKTATFVTDRQVRFERFVEEQVARYLRGETPLHVVDYA